MRTLDSVMGIKKALLRKLLLDRTPLEEQIKTLSKGSDILSKNRDLHLEREALLKEVDRLRSSLAAPRTYAFQGYDIPIDLMMLTGAGPDTFDAISADHIHQLKKWIGLNANHTLIEIGCGIGRDAIPLTKILTNGRYIGIDIIGRSIEWCKSRISVHHPNFEFYHFDVKDQLHNAAGITATTDIKLPAANQSVDRITLYSVFTHMLRDDIEHYLREFRRVLKPNGLVYATTFIFNDEILARARETNLTPYDLRFEHIQEEGCRINDPVHPLGAVAFTKEAWEAMIERSGLKHAKPTLKGSWSGYYKEPEEGQDALILTPV